MRKPKKPYKKSPVEEIYSKDFLAPVKTEVKNLDQFDIDFSTSFDPDESKVAFNITESGNNEKENKNSIIKSTERDINVGRNISRKFTTPRIF